MAIDYDEADDVIPVRRVMFFLRTPSAEGSVRFCSGKKATLLPSDQPEERAGGREPKSDEQRQEEDDDDPVFSSV